MKPRTNRTLQCWPKLNKKGRKKKRNFTQNDARYKKNAKLRGSPSSHQSPGALPFPILYGKPPVSRSQESKRCLLFRSVCFLYRSGGARTHPTLPNRIDPRITNSDVDSAFNLRAVQPYEDYSVVIHDLVISTRLEKRRRDVADVMPNGVPSAKPHPFSLPRTH